MYSWAVKNIDGVKFFTYISDEDVKTNAEAHNLEERYRASKTISGTRSHHSFVPISESTMQMLRLSGDDLWTTVSLGENSSHNAVSARQSNQYQPGKYVACINDRDWYIGNIEERSEDNSDVHVKFMKRSQNNTLSWPQGLQDECWVPFQDVLCIIDAPKAQGRGGRHYSLSSATIEQIISLVQNLS
ncbi:hypothetical protein HOLleu_19193 [Holothuria leucospilota]|uniref:Uncharacterized protein n=1 Tax=Holothuria leucospilota TaxID=206669 RepID=A0A9Q1H774_HOLLE|nr:hypothetical protein HOLleu_19193 [Holothuria leucospilota]